MESLMSMKLPPMDRIDAAYFGVAFFKLTLAQQYAVVGIINKQAMGKKFPRALLLMATLDGNIHR
jgi:hypothetical protein